MSDKLIRSSCEAANFTILIAGDLNRAVEICEKFCLEGFCVTVDPTLYVYTYGREEGVKVGIINYARIPSNKKELKEKAVGLGHLLMEGLNQGSFSVVGENESIYISRRDCDKNGVEK